MKYLFWAYAATWLLLFAYTFSLGLRQNKITKELNWLKKVVAGKQGNK